MSERSPEEVGLSSAARSEQKQATSSAGADFGPSVPEGSEIPLYSLREEGRECAIWWSVIGGEIDWSSDAGASVEVGWEAVLVVGQARESMVETIWPAVELSLSVAALTINYTLPPNNNNTQRQFHPNTQVKQVKRGEAYLVPHE